MNTIISSPQYMTKPQFTKRNPKKKSYPSELLLQRFTDFRYIITPENQIIKSDQSLANYLEYATELKTLTELWHPSEKKKLLRLHQEMVAFAKKNELSAGDFGIKIINRFKKADGSFIKTMQYLFPFISQETDQTLLHAFCMDVDWLYSGDQLTFQVVRSGNAVFDVPTAQQHFSNVLTDRLVHFSERQLQVLRLWSELDSPKEVADRLHIKVRTLETHLKNARKKLNVRRTLDVVMYAKKNGLL